MSAAAMGPAARWNTEIATRLAASQFGVICLTRDALMAPWILFEAGALAKSLHNACIVTYLFDLNPTVVQGPLAQFKPVTADKESTWKLVHSMYSALDGLSRSEDQMRRVFDKFWPDLEEALNHVPKNSSSKARSHKALLEEILENVHGLTRVSYALVEQAPPSLKAQVRHWLSLEQPSLDALTSNDETDLVEWDFDKDDNSDQAEENEQDEVLGVEEASHLAPLLSGLSLPKVLVVEDNENTQYLIQTLLEEDMSVTTVETAAEALLEAFRNEYSLVVVDINLGEGPNGIDLLSELRAMPAYRDVPIVAITAYALPGDKERFLEMGFADYLAKPFQADDLLALAAWL